MNFLKKLFSKKESNYTTADALTLKLMTVGMAYIYKRDNSLPADHAKNKEEFIKQYFQILNKIKGLDVNHRHLSIVIDICTSDINTDEALSFFLKKTNAIIDVFGEVIDINEKCITIKDIDKTKPAPRITTINIHYSSENFKDELSKLKKGEKRGFKIRLPKDITFSDMSEVMDSHIMKPLNFHLAGMNWVIRIFGTDLIRYDITGELIAFHGKNGVELINQ